MEVKQSVVLYRKLIEGNIKALKLQLEAFNGLLEQYLCDDDIIQPHKQRIDTYVIETQRLLAIEYEKLLATYKQQ